MLLGWLFWLFAGIAHACIPAPATTLVSPTDATLAAMGQENRSNEESPSGSDSCKMFCDAQASVITKEKPMTEPGTDHPGDMASPSHAIALYPIIPTVVVLPRHHLLPYTPNHALRSTRLTL